MNHTPSKAVERMYEIGKEIDRLYNLSLLDQIRTAIAADRCDGESEYAAGVNAACRNHLALIDSMSASLRGIEGEPIADQSCKASDAKDLSNGR